MPMLRVLIADDHYKVRQGLRDLLQEEPEAMLVGEAKTGHETLEQARAESWDVVVLDINFPDQSGLDVLRAIKQERPTLPVLLLSMHPGSQYIKGSLKAGASGFLSKETAPDELKAAINTVLSGGVYVSRALAGE